MSLSMILAILAPFEPAVLAELKTLEGQGYADLNALIAAKIASPQLQQALLLVSAFVNTMALFGINLVPQL